ncbi:MAG: phosphodiester glycosidase family protein, partial [Bacteroidota bacterium]
MPTRIFYIILILTFPAHALTQPLLEWKSLDSLNKKIPDGIEIFKAAGNIEGDTVTAYYSITDISRGDLVFYPLYSEYNQKPGKYFSESPEDIVLITNGGYFGTNVSYSLVINNYNTLVPNTRAVNRSHNNDNYLYYPTRSAFGVDPNLNAEATYIYTFSNNNQTYSYPEPSPNTTENLPLPQPTPEYPEGGETWNVSEAIGGGPLLIQDSVINTNYTPELFPVDITGSIAPRTAIGVRGDGQVINLVIDGRQDHSKGVSLHTLSEILLELGCINAINLDGGGSSVFSVYDEVINKPSDGNPRYIPSVVSIKKAFMLRNNDPAYFNRLQIPLDSLENKRIPETKTLIFDKGETGVYSFKDILPAEYRLEFYNNSESEYNYSDSIELIFFLSPGREDTLYLNQDSLTRNHFVNIGSRQLSPRDSLKITNKSTDGYLHLDVLRLIKTGSGLPEIDLDPQVYYGNYSTGDSIRFKINAYARNSSRKITAFRVYEIIQDNYLTISQKSFSAVDHYEDSVSYFIQKDPDQIRLKSVVYDER